jgi:hypothetical protein
VQRALADVERDEVRVDAVEDFGFELGEVEDASRAKDAGRGRGGNDGAGGLADLLVERGDDGEGLRRVSGR